MSKTRNTTPDMHNKPRRTAVKAAPRAKASDHHYDVMIIGGGLSGGALASLLGSEGFRVACIDRDAPVTQTTEAFDGRTTAISWGSQKILNRAGVWDSLDALACPIRTIDILDGGSPVLLRFRSEEVGDQSFGWIFENRLLRAALFNRMQELDTVDHLAPAQIEALDQQGDMMRVTLKDGRVLTAPLVVGADGRNSFTRDWAGITTRSWSYHQRAVVCVAEHQHPHDNVAVEHFHEQGPFATLPMLDGPDGAYRSSVVWTEHCPEHKSALHFSQEVFDAALTARFPDQYGWVRQAGGRYAFPLSLQHAHRYTAPRLALVADAAHGIHPIAGQGLNMGFRDLDALCDILIAARDANKDTGADTDYGAAAVLAQYESARRVDNMAMAGATDSLNRLFSTGLPPLPLLRKAGLKIVANFAPAKRFFMHQAMGAGSGGMLHELVREAKAAS
jgi:2-octaprenyl-6-methoxyphenol hydroxylase